MQDYASQVAAEVAARYGVTVMPDAVQIIPRGVSSHPGYVYQGNSLVPIVDEGPSTAMKRLINGSWKEAARKRRVMAAKAREEAKPKERKPRDTSAMQAAAEARRAQVADMAAKGATIKEIASYFGILEKSAAKYCRDNGIAVARGSARTLYETEAREARYKRALAFGQEAPRTSDDYAAFLGLSKKGAYNYIKARNLPYVCNPPGVKRSQERAAQREREAERRAEIDARREQVRHLHGTGMPMRAMAKTLGVGIGAIQRDIKALGLTAPKIRKAPAEVEDKKKRVERSKAVMRRKAQAAMDKRLAKLRDQRDAEAA